MTSSAETISPKDLQVSRVIHDSEFTRVELLVDEAGNQYAKKTYKNASPSVAIESNFLESSNQREFNFLVLPKLISATDREIIQTFIEREHQTRDSIQERDWNDDEFHAFDQGLREFQLISLDKGSFSIKQKVMGLLYPVFKLLLNIPKLWRRRELKLLSIPKLCWLAFVYAIKRPFHRNVTVHYDLQTLNCALTPDQKISILDFEFPYFKGDRLFDVCYFSTIAPQAIHDWTFQKQIIQRQLEPISWTTKVRLRLILIICCQVRVLFFNPDSKECQVYRESLELLLSGRRFNQFYRSLVESQK